MRAVRRPIALVLALALGAGLLASAERARGEDDGADRGGTLVVEELERNEDGSYVYSFGEVEQEAELAATFRCRNEGPGTLTGLRAVGDCGCYGVELSRTELPAGETGTLDIKFRTLKFSGAVRKRLRIFTAESPTKPVVIRLHLDVVAGVILDPGRVWFGDVLVGNAPSKTVVVKWHEGIGKPFRVTSVEVPGHDFEIERTPYADGKWKGTAVRFTFKTPPPLGMFSATALIRTDHPDHPRISVPLTANVTGKVWVQSRRIYFGWVRKGQAKSTRLLVRPLDKSVSLGDVQVRSRNGRVQVAIEKHPRGTDEWWLLRVSVPETAEVGKLDDVVEVRTAVPGEEITEIEVRGEVLPVGR